MKSLHSVFNQIPQYTASLRSKYTPGNNEGHCKNHRSKVVTHSNAFKYLQPTAALIEKMKRDHPHARVRTVLYVDTHASRRRITFLSAPPFRLDIVLYSTIKTSHSTCNTKKKLHNGSIRFRQNIRPYIVHWLSHKTTTVSHKKKSTCSQTLPRTQLHSHTHHHQQKQHFATPPK